jgi:ABC-2 type transport system ATP-binding protein
MALGLSSPDAGTVSLFGGAPDVARRQRVGLVPEQRSLPDRDRVGELIRLMLRLRGFSGAEVRKRSNRWIERMELGDLQHRRIGQLSKGQAQKAQIAMALAHDPDLLVLDEPFTGLDPRHQMMISDVFQDAADRGATVVLSTHRLREAQELIDEVVMMSLGHKVLEGKLGELRLAHGTRRYRVLVQSGTAWMQGDDVAQITRDREEYIVHLKDGCDPNTLLRRALDQGAHLVKFEQVLPTLPELFEAHTLSRAEPKAAS